MIIINNVPVGYQKQFDGKMVFILLHKLMEPGKYQNFYMDSKNQFDFIILDNSVFELGESLDGELLMKWARLLKEKHPKTPIEIIIPDDYADRNKTLLLFYDFLNKYSSEDFLFQAVPQGNSHQTLKDCLEEMLLSDRVSTIGINKLWDLNKMKYIFPKIIMNGKQIHKLGVNNLSDWVHLGQDKRIRSADSRKLAQIVTRVEDPWDEKLNPNQLKILKTLVKEIEKW